MSPCTLGVAAVHRGLLSQRPKLEKTPNICMRGRLRNDLFFSRGVSISKKVQRKKYNQMQYEYSSWICRIICKRLCIYVPPDFHSSKLNCISSELGRRIMRRGT